MPFNRPPPFGPELSQGQALCSDTPWSPGDPPGGQLKRFPSQLGSSQPPARARPVLTQPFHTNLDPFPTRYPGPAPGRPAARPAGRWRRSALTAGARLPLALSAQAGWREQAAGEGGELGRPSARAPAGTYPPPPSRTPRARAREAAPLARPP